MVPEMKVVLKLLQDKSSSDALLLKLLCHPSCQSVTCKQVLFLGREI